MHSEWETVVLEKFSHTDPCVLHASWILAKIQYRAHVFVTLHYQLVLSVLTVGALCCPLVRLRGFWKLGVRRIEVKKKTITRPNLDGVRISSCMLREGSGEFGEMSLGSDHWFVSYVQVTACPAS